MWTWSENIITRDHSFLWNAEFRAEPWNLPISAEFLCFHWIWYWPGGSKILITIHRRHDFDTKYMTATRALIRGILRILSWGYLKQCPVYLADKQCVSFGCWRQTVLHIWSDSVGRRKLVTIHGEFGKIWRGKLCSLVTTAELNQNRKLKKISKNPYNIPENQWIIIFLQNQYFFLLYKILNSCSINKSIVQNILHW